MQSSHDYQVTQTRKRFAIAAEHLLNACGSITEMHSAMGELLQAYGEVRNQLAQDLLESGLDVGINEYKELERLRRYTTQYIKDDPIRKRFVEILEALNAGNITKAKRLTSNALNRDDLISERQRAISKSKPRKLDEISTAIESYLPTEPDLTLLPLVQRLEKDHILDEVDFHAQEAFTRTGRVISLRALEGRLARAKNRQYQNQ